jgi:hypothetical protein
MQSTVVFHHLVHRHVEILIFWQLKGKRMLPVVHERIVQTMISCALQHAIQRQWLGICHVWIFLAYCSSCSNFQSQLCFRMFHVFLNGQPTLCPGPCAQNAGILQQAPGAASPGECRKQARHKAWLREGSLRDFRAPPEVKLNGPSDHSSSWVFCWMLLDYLEISWHIYNPRIHTDLSLIWDLVICLREGMGFPQHTTS